MGTADYMAPEQASDSHAVDIRADIYSLGCTLYKLLAGCAPFEGSQYKGTFDKMTAHVQQTIPPIENLLPQIPVELAAIIEKMLAKDPADRFSQPADVVEAIMPFCMDANLVDIDQKVETASRDVVLNDCKAATSGRGPITNGARAAQPARRRTSIPIAIGLLIIGIGFGFSLGIMITIKKDGKTTTVEAPEGSNVHVNDQGNVTVDLSKGEGRDQTTPGSYRIDLSAGAGKAAVPPEPYTIAPGDSLVIRAVGTLSTQPIDGVYVVEPTGTIALPPAYGRVNVQGLSLIEAEKAIVKHLQQILRNPEVSVTLSGWVERSKLEAHPQPHRIAPGDILDIWVNGTLVDQPIHGQYLVEPDGQVTLGPAYGRVNLKGQTFEEAEGTVLKQLQQILRSPEVSITLRGWRKELKPSPKEEEGAKKARELRDAEEHNKLGLALAKDGQMHEAIEHYKQALRLYPEYAEAYYNLALAHAEFGQRVEAAAAAQKALELAKSQGYTERAKQIKDWLNSYRANESNKSSITPSPEPASPPQ